MRFRQSMMKTWMECPLQAKFKEVQGLPRVQGSKAAFGTCIHAALDHYNRTGNLDEAIKLFLEVWDDPSILGVTPQVWNKYTTFGGLRQRGIEILKQYDDQQRWDTRQVLFTEHRFLVPFGRHELEGTVDLGEIKRNHRGTDIFRICDYKTNARRPNLGALLLNIQFTTYIYASLQPEFWLGNGDGFPPAPNGEWWSQMLVDMPRRGIWFQLWDNCKEIDAGGRDFGDFGRLYRLCDEIEKAIKADVFVPSIGEACQLCDYANGPCPVEIPSREEHEAQRLEDAEAWL